MHYLLILVLCIFAAGCDVSKAEAKARKPLTMAGCAEKSLPLPASAFVGGINLDPSLSTSPVPAPAFYIADRAWKGSKGAAAVAPMAPSILTTASVSIRGYRFQGAGTYTVDLYRFSPTTGSTEQIASAGSDGNPMVSWASTTFSRAVALSEDGAYSLQFTARDNGASMRGGWVDVTVCPTAL